MIYSVQFTLGGIGTNKPGDVTAIRRLGPGVRWDPTNFRGSYPMVSWLALPYGSDTSG